MMTWLTIIFVGFVSWVVYSYIRTIIYDDDACKNSFLIIESTSPR
jgi:uncharacterized protein with PQ loop repeat